MGTNKIKNSGPLAHALAHHARELAPLAQVLGFCYLTELQPRGWDIDQAGNPRYGGKAGKGFGARSYFISKGGREYHFRPGGLGPDNKYHEIEVRDRYR